MLPYILLLFIPALVPLFVYRPTRHGVIYEASFIVRKRSEMLILLFFLGFFILLSLRDITVGRDLLTYKSIFESCQIMSFRDLSKMPWELGYTVYNKLITFISDDYRFFLIITALIILLPIYVLFSQEKEYGYLLVVLFINMPCFLMIFSGLRQAISISLGILAFMLIDKKKYILCGVLILLAITFHTSAFVLVLLYPAFFMKIKTKHLLYIAPVILLIYIFRIPIITFFISLAPSKYIEFYGEVQQTGAFGMMILFLIFLIFSFVVMDESDMSNKDYFMRNILLIATIMQLFVPVNGLVQRISYYFIIFVPVALLRFVRKPKPSMVQVSSVAIIVMSVFFTLYFFYTALFSTDNLLDVFPYKFFWSSL